MKLKKKPQEVLEVLKEVESPKKVNPREMQRSYMEKMEESLTAKKVVFFDPETNLNIVDDYLILPPEITEVSSRELGEYLNAFTQQKVYLRTLLGRMELLVEEARREYFSASEEHYRKYSMNKMSETAKERLINSQPKVQPLFNDFIDYKKRQVLVEYAISNIEDILFMISREVTRRTGDFNDEGRAHNIGKR